MSANENEIYFAITTEDGKSQILSKPMTEDELIDYKNHPEAFFGKIQHPLKKAEDPYDLFEFFVDSYRKTAKERLLEFMKDTPDFDALVKMEQFDLLLEYSERWVAAAVNNGTNERHIPIRETPDEQITPGRSRYTLASPLREPLRG